MPDKACPSCIYFVPIGSDTAPGMCARYPRWRKVASGHWCGEHIRPEQTLEGVVADFKEAVFTKYAAAEDQEQKKRGRPKGSRDKKPRRKVNRKVEGADAQ